MKKILVVHPGFDVIGGAEIVALNIISFLLKHFDGRLSLLTLVPVNWSTVFSLVQISFSTSGIENMIAKCPLPVLKRKGELELLKLAYLHRDAKRLAAEYDICFSTYNEIDFSKPGIQYVHHPSFAPRKLLQELHFLETRNVLDTIPLANFFYRKIIGVVSGDQLSGYRQNFTMVNSGFMKDVIAKTFGIVGEVVYPSFLDDAIDLEANSDWQAKEFRFVTVGRISPDKQLERTIVDFSILAREFPQADFVIAGRSVNREYEGLLQKMAGDLGVHVRIRTDLSQKELKNLLRTSKFYVHSKINEHFGIAIVEAAAMGCLALAHDSGASREIVNSGLLLYRSSADLVERVRLLLNDEGEREEALRALRDGLGRFKAGGFYTRLQEILAPHL